MEKQRTTVPAVGLLLLGMVLVVIGCSRTGEPQAGQTTPGEESAMKTGNTSMPSPAALPPIDAAAPRNFETATFGLG
jgi:hypothetical protein